MGSLHTEASPSRRHHSRSEGLQCPVPHPAPLHSPDTGICVSGVTVRRRGGFISCVSQSLTCPSAALQVKAQPPSIRQFQSRASLLLLVARQNLFCPSVADYPWQHTAGSGHHPPHCQWPGGAELARRLGSPRWQAAPPAPRASSHLQRQPPPPRLKGRGCIPLSQNTHRTFRKQQNEDVNYEKRSCQDY